MKKILLVCDAGMSTSLLVSKMQKITKEKDIDVEINAVPKGQLQKYKDHVDICLVGPQIKYALNDIKATLPSIPVEVIAMKDYGMGDGEKILDFALNLI